MSYKFSALALLSILSPLTFAGSIETPPPQSDFSGFYIGLGAGLSTLMTQDSFTTTRASGLGGDTGTNDYTYTSILYAFQLGYGMTLSNNVYLGLDGLITYAPLYTTNETGFSTAAGATLIVGNNSIKTTSNPTYSINGVLGYEVNPHTLPFIEVGISFGEIDRQFTIKRTRTNSGAGLNVKYQTSLSTGAYNTEYDIGLGVRRLFGQHCVASTVLMYTYLGTNTGSATVAIPSTTDRETHTRSVENYTLSLLGTVSYLFNS